MSQAIPAITIQANVPYEFTVPESPAPASAIIVTNTGLVPVQWSTGQSSGYIPNGTTLAISVTAAGTIVTFTADTGLTMYITVWTINDGPVFVPQGSPITEVNLAAGATVELAAGTTVNINNVTKGTINIDEIASGNQLGSNAVEDNSISPPSSPNVTVVGATGTATYNYQQSLLIDSINGIETTASPVTTITNGNVTLSSSNYNTVEVQGLIVPDYLGGNLVYDSTLSNATSPTGPSWIFQNLANGSNATSFSVNNPGTDSAEIVWTGDGTANTDNPAAFPAPLVSISIRPFETVTLSSVLTCPAGVSGSLPNIQLSNAGPIGTLASIEQVVGNSSLVSVTYTNNSLNTLSATVMAQVSSGGVSITVPNGSQIIWSKIQITRSNNVLPYQAGPLWTIKTFRNGVHIPALDTTLFSCNDEGGVALGNQPQLINLTGQTVKVSDQTLSSLNAPVINSTSEVWSSGPDTILQPSVPIVIRQVSVTCVTTVTNSAGYLTLTRANGFSFTVAYFSGSSYGLVWDSEVQILMNNGDYITFTPEPVSGSYATFQITLLWGQVFLPWGNVV